MNNVTPKFLPNWVPVPQAVASMVSFLSRAIPGTASSASALARISSFDVHDFACMCCVSSPLLLNSLPCFIGVEFCHRASDLVGGLAQVLLIHNAILVDDEGHDTGIVVLRGISDHGKATSHLAVDDVVLRGPFRISALSIEHVEVVTVERLMGIRFDLQSFGGCVGHQRSKRTLGLPIRRRPIQAILLTFVADELLGV